MKIYLALLGVLLISACDSSSVKQANSNVENKYLSIHGQTMGTTYNITYDGNDINVQKSTIDSILIAINNSVSTYLPHSTISKINQNSGAEIKEILVNSQSFEVSSIRLEYDKHFDMNYRRSERIYLDTKGAFDPTIMPLVNYWGFGYTPKRPITKIDSSKVDSMLSYVGMHKIQYESGSTYLDIIKPDKTKLDFSAIAKGYAVDFIGSFLTDLSIKNYLVEIGGEVQTKGVNPNNEAWTLALNKPTPESSTREFQELISLSDLSLASSGNYRNYYKVYNKIYGHEINPATGYPEMNDLLGVSVVAANCMEADALATAFMIMGFEEAKTFVQSNPTIEAAFFISNDEGDIVSHFSKGLTELIKK